jgi:hypothetical protein
MIDNSAAAWPLVLGLLLGRSPTAIARRIWAVIVDAIQCFAVRTIAHVGEKIAKTAWSLPSIADLNAPPAIRRPKFIFGTTAPVKHGLPRTMRRRTIFPLTGVSMFRCPDTCCFDFMAAARFGVPFSQVLALDDASGTARATATPVSVPYVLNRRKAAKLMSSEVNEVHRDQP